MMKAVVWTKYGSPDVLQLKEVEKPTPKDNEVLIKVQAATVTAGDCEARSLKFPFWLSFPMRIYIGFLRPTRIRSLGQELAGEVETVGKEVTLFKPGDPVFGTTGFRFGAYEDFTKRGETYDVIFDVVGKSPFAGSIGSLKQNGYYLIANPRLAKMIRGAWASRNSGKKVIFEAAGRRREDLLFLKALFEAGTIKTVIDRRYPLAQTAEAHRYVETGQKKGNVIIVHPP